MKWLLMGRLQARHAADVVLVGDAHRGDRGGLTWGLAGKVLFEHHLTGTPFLPWALRLFGA